MDNSDFIKAPRDDAMLFLVDKSTKAHVQILP